MTRHLFKYLRYKYKYRNDNFVLRVGLARPNLLSGGKEAVKKKACIITAHSVPIL